KLLAEIKDARQRHRERHRPSGFEFALADRIQFLNREHWDAVTAASGYFLSRSYLSLLEECCREEFCSRYALIYRRGEPQAALAVQMLEVSAAQQETAQVLRRFSYRPIATDPDMVLELKPEWRSYGDYLNSLDRKYRKSAQTIAKEIADAGAVVERVKDLDSCRTRLHELYLAVHESAAVRPATLSPDYLPGLAKSAGEAFSCVVIRKGGEILGFVSVVRDGELAIGYYI